jgi:hypothetical protein
MPNFSEIGAKKQEDIVRPPLPPPGGWLFRITKPHEVRDVKSTSGDGREWESVEYNVRGVAPTADVDSDAAREFGDASKIMLRVSWMFDKQDAVAFQQTENQLKRFLVDHVKCWQDGMSLAEAMAAAVNQEFIGEVKWVQDKRDPDNWFANIGKTAPKS